MKKAVSLVLSFLFIMSSFCAPVSAKPETAPEFSPQNYVGGFLPPEKCIGAGTEVKTPPRKKALFAASRQPLKNFLEEQLLAGAETITLYPQYKYDDQTVYDELRSLLYSNYKILAYPVMTDIFYYGSYVMSFKPIYFTPEEGKDAALEMMEAEINKYLDAAEEIPDNDVVGKILVIYDLFCKNNVYATEELEEEKNTETINYDIRTAYHLFKTNRAVCQGNALALKAVYDALNERLKKNESDDDIIETSFCSSVALGHIWNVVKTGGKWYHLDETWDDCPYADEKGEIYAYHNYFLKSEDAFEDHIANRVYDWTYYADEDVICDDKKYEDGYIFSNPYDRPCATSYENGKYRMDFFYIANPFRTNGIKMTKILVADIFPDEEGTKIYYYTGSAINVNPFWTSYDETGEMTDFKEGNSLSLNEGFSVKSFYGMQSNTRLFHWAEDGITPLCPAMDIE